MSKTWQKKQYLLPQNTLTAEHPAGELDTLGEEPYS